MSVSTASDVSRLLSLKKKGLSTATVYVKGFGRDDGNFDAWLEQHDKIESTRGWRSDVFGYKWPSGNAKRTGVWGAVLGGLGVFASRFYPPALAASFVGKYCLPAGAAALRFAWNYKTAEKNARALAPDLADHIRKLNFEYEKVRVVAHSLGCRLVIEAAARLPQEYLPSQTWLLAPACREDVLKGKGKIATERTWLYYTERDAILRYLFPLVSGGKALGAVGPKRSHPGLVAEDVSEKFGFWVHREYENRFADLVGQEEDRSIRGQQTKVFLPARERFEPRTEMPSSALRITDEQAMTAGEEKIMAAGRIGGEGQERRRSDRSAPLPMTKESLQANWGRKSIEKTAAANAIPVVKTSTATVGQEAARRVMDRDRIVERQVTQRARADSVQKTKARQRDERKAPKKKGLGWGWRLALSGTAALLGVPLIF